MYVHFQCGCENDWHSSPVKQTSKQGRRLFPKLSHASLDYIEGAVICDAL